MVSYLCIRMVPGAAAHTHILWPIRLDLDCVRVYVLVIRLKRIFPSICCWSRQTNAGIYCYSVFIYQMYYRLGRSVDWQQLI